MKMTEIEKAIAATEDLTGIDNRLHLHVPCLAKVHDLTADKLIIDKPN